MNVRDLLSFRSRSMGWRAADAAEPPKERIVTLGWLCMVATFIGAMLLAAYESI